MENNKYASFFRRLLAIILDIFLLFILGASVLIILLNSSNDENFIANLILFIIYLLVIHGILLIFLYSYLVSKFGGTPGKLLSGIKIENEDGSKLTFKQAIFREYIAKSVSFAFLGLGFFWIFKTPKKQGWHDMISSTVVVKKRNIISGLLSLLSVIIISVLLSAGLLKSINQLNEKVNYITNINTNINKFY
ncbi:hypothetical protein A3B64_01220 [candidate division WWE3 bacterium RIFCSPLOWO2_01_FULL_37_24]|nr:MAG: hypothetical protein A3B64_01220 [candidate division WWE3 bacterium RIFCSPLOWO2_01_FULL_37_24]